MVDGEYRWLAHTVGGHLGAAWTFGPTYFSAGPVESMGSWDLAAEEQEMLLSIDSNVRRSL